MIATFEKFLAVLGDGVPPADLSVFQVLLRATIIFIATLIIVRVANKRFFAKKTAFDVIMALILASMMARAINGAERLGPTIVAGFWLAGLHSVLGKLACRWPRLGGIIKGHSEVLVRGGELDGATMARHGLSRDDLDEQLRLRGVEKLGEVKVARLERNGEVSVLKAAGGGGS